MNKATVLRARYYHDLAAAVVVAKDERSKLAKDRLTKEEEEVGYRHRRERVGDNKNEIGNYYRENMASEFRRKFVKNNPIVSQYYVKHFQKYRKPPFSGGTGRKRCGQRDECGVSSTDT